MKRDIIRQRHMCGTQKVQALHGNAGIALSHIPIA